MKKETLQMIPEEYHSQAISLENIGISDVAWPRCIALEIIDILKSNNIAILGGDVLKEENGQYRYDYSDWHTDKEVSETWDEYVLRSHTETREYLTNFFEFNDGKYIYTIVCRGLGEHEH